MSPPCDFLEGRRIHLGLLSEHVLPALRLWICTIFQETLHGGFVCQQAE